MSDLSLSTQITAETQTWAPRRRLTLSDVRRHSSLVKFLRLMFLGLSIMSLLVYLGFILANSFGAKSAPVTINAEEIITMINPRFSGRDASGTAFAITAEKAKRRAVEGNVVELDRPILSDTGGTQVRAPSGLYDRDNGVLDLYEDVVLLDAGGYEFYTTEARIYVNEDRVVGSAPVSGKGPMGDVRADSYEILDGGNRTILRGNAYMVIYPSEEDEATDVDESVTNLIITDEVVDN